MTLERPTTNLRGSNRREAILNFFINYHARNGIAPTVDEIAAAVGTVKSNVFYHLKVLEGQGYLHHVPQKARAWTITGD